MSQTSDIEKAVSNFMLNSIEFDTQADDLKSYLLLINKSIKEIKFDFEPYKAQGYDDEILENLNYHYQK